MNLCRYDLKTICDGTDCGKCNHSPAFHMGVESAHERMIPKKPVEFNKCPNCWGGLIMYTRGIHFCDDCGQAIDYN